MSFLDLLSNGVGASILLLLVFTISRGVVAPVKAGGSEVLRARYLVRDLAPGVRPGARPRVAVLISRDHGQAVGVPLEVLDHQELIRGRQWYWERLEPLATSVSAASYPSDRDGSKRDYDVVVENPGRECWSFSVRFVDRERLRGYETDDPGVEVVWLAGGVRSPAELLRPGERSTAYGLRLEQHGRNGRIARCSAPPVGAQP